MGKPSIFSNNYAKKMRMRKIKYTIIIIIIITVALFALLFRGYIKGVGSKLFNIKQSNTTQKDNKAADNKSDTPKVDTKPNTPEKVVEEKGYDIELSNGKQIKLVYEEKDNNKTFKYISPIDSGVISDISPSKKAIVILDSANQDILYYDIEGKKLDLTKREYRSSEATSVIYTKVSQLAKNPSYIWHGSPKFLDEGKIAYISQLPWFNSNTKYVWMVDVKSGEHVPIIPMDKISSENLSFGELDEKGLMIKTTDKTFYLKSDLTSIGE